MCVCDVGFIFFLHFLKIFVLSHTHAFVDSAEEMQQEAEKSLGIQG